MSNVLGNLQFRMGLEFLFTLDGKTLMETLDWQYRQCPSTTPVYSKDMLSKATLDRMASILGGDKFEVNQNPNNDYTGWSATEAPWLIRRGEPHPYRDMDVTQPETSGKSHVVGVLLISPIMSYSVWDDSIRQTARILKRLTCNRNDGLSDSSHHATCYQGHRAWLNEKCSFQIQYNMPSPAGSVGLSNDSWPLNTLQNVIALWGTYEQAIEHLQPMHHRAPRVADSTSLWTIFPPGISKRQFRGEIYSTRNVAELQNISEPRRREKRFAKVSLKVSAASSAEHPGCHGIEFREAAGTMDIEAVVFWLGFTTAILKLTHAMGHQGLTFNLDDHPNLSHGHAYLVDLMNMIKLPERTQQYGWMLLFRHSDGSQI